jgi:AcrR family transcriptional regulator
VSNDAPQRSRSGPRGLDALLEQTFHSRLAVDLPAGEGLRQRKKRLMRDLISDTATALFLARGFDEVRVAEVAEACGVSEKTVYNYFPSKESLLLDREEAMTADIRRALGPDASRGSPIDAAVMILESDLRGIYDDERDGPLDLTIIRRFSELIEKTPVLRAAHRDMMDRLVEVAAEAMAARAGVNPDDPEPQIAAHAILGLWRVQFRSMLAYSDGTRSAAEVRAAVLSDVRRAARLIDTGLWAFGLIVQGSDGREQLRAAADSANEARKQVLSALKQARDAWRQVKATAQRHEPRRDQDHGRPPRR